MANTSILAAFERMWQHVTNALSNKSDISHNHDDMYYTETEVDSKVSDINTSITNTTNAKLEEAKTYTDEQIESHTHSWNDLEDRPFGEEAATEVVIEETTETDSIPVIDNTLFTGDYIVTVDGIEYSCTAYGNTIYGDMTLGDSRLLYPDLVANGTDMDMSNPVDMPFAICSYTDGGFLEEKTYADVFYADSNTHTIKVEKAIGEKIQTLDEKYIPDTIARTAYVDENFALKSDLENIDLSEYETKADAQTKLDEAKQYTETMASTKASIDHVHNDMYYTESEVNTLLDEKVSSITVSGNQILYYLENQGEALATGTLMNATTSESGFMSASDKTKLNGIAEGANAYTLPAATSSALGGVKVGNNITNSSGTISLTSSNVTTALGYTPATQTYVTEQIQAAIQASWEASY